MESITLQCRIAGEYAPRMYTMTGGSFETMLMAVRRLPQHKFERHFRLEYWLVNREGLNQLQVQGFTVEQDPDVRAQSPEHTILSPREVFPGVICVEIWFEVRNRDGSMDTIQRGPGQARLYIFLRDAYREFLLQAITAQRQQLGLSFGAKREDVVYAVARCAAALYGKRVQGVFQQHLNQRTLDDFRKALEMAEQLIEKDEQNGMNTFSAVMLLDNAELLPGDHPTTRHMVHEAEEQQRAEREARKAERLARVPELVADWFGRLTKAEIAQFLATKANSPLSEKEIRTTRKPELIARVVSNCALCEQLLR